MTTPPPSTPPTHATGPSATSVKQAEGALGQASRALRIDFGAFTVSEQHKAVQAVAAAINHAVAAREAELKPSYSIQPGGAPMSPETSKAIHEMVSLLALQQQLKGADVAVTIERGRADRAEAALATARAEVERQKNINLQLAGVENEQFGFESKLTKAEADLATANAALEKWKSSWVSLGILADELGYGASSRPLAANIRLHLAQSAARTRELVDGLREIYDNAKQAYAHRVSAISIIAIAEPLILEHVSGTAGADAKPGST